LDALLWIKPFSFVAPHACQFDWGRMVRIRMALGGSDSLNHFRAAVHVQYKQCGGIEDQLQGSYGSPFAKLDKIWLPDPRYEHRAAKENDWNLAGSNLDVGDIVKKNENSLSYTK
jgi:hypothetical protein